MPHTGYIQSENHKKLLSIRALARGNNGWLGRKHRPEVVVKMARPKSDIHRLHMSQAAIKRWNKNKPQWIIQEKQQVREIQAPLPPVYRDIYMEDDITIGSDGTIWRDA